MAVNLLHSRLFTDVVGLALGSAVSAAWLRGNEDAAWLTAQAVAVIATLGAMGQYGASARHSGPVEWWRPIGVTVIVGSAFGAARLLLADEAFGGPDPVSVGMAFAACLGLARAILRSVHAVARMSGRGLQTTLIVGSGQVGQTVARRLHSNFASGLRPVGFIDDAPRTGAPGSAPLPILGGVDDLEAVVTRHDVQCVIVAFGLARDDRVVQLVRRCWELGLEVLVVPRLFELHRLRPNGRQLGRLPLQRLPPPRSRRWSLRAKHAFDRAFAAVAVLVLSPLLIAVAAAVRLTMGRPVLFRQQRVGRDGHHFEMLKFRTMEASPDHGAEADLAWAASVLGTGTASIGTPAKRRCTRVGAFLRRTSLDELPQVLNVLRGEMSLIGPRPERVAYAALFTGAIDGYANRHRVKGGLTGWAQVHGLRGETSLHDRVEWDNAYIDDWSLLLDAQILWRTLPAIVRASATTSPHASDGASRTLGRHATRLARGRFTRTAEAPAGRPSPQP